MHRPVYMDYHATTPVDPRVLSAMLPYFSEKFGNASSRQHAFGWDAESGVEVSRTLVARSIGASPGEIIFTGGATESNNLALKGAAEAYRPKGNHIITVQTEHKSVLDSCKRLSKIGVQTTYLPVDESGLLSVDNVEAAITPKTILVSVMLANNEIGTIQPVAEIGSLCRARGILFHTDATQGIGKIPVDVNEMNIDLLSMSGHKIYGPKGIGALFVRNKNPRVAIAAQTDGGGHERGIRSGTLNVPGIVGLGKALELAVASMGEESARTRQFRDRMIGTFTRELGDAVLNGHPTLRLPNNLNMSFLRVDENALMMSMKDIALSTGSACSSAAPEPSHVLRALRLPAARLSSAIRFGLGRLTTEEEVEFVIARVISEVRKLRSYLPNAQGVATPSTNTNQALA